MRPTGRHFCLSSLPLALLVAACGSGCSSVLSTASLKDLVWDPGDHAAELEPASDAAEAAADEQAAGEAETAAADAERRQAAIEEAEERLARLGTLPPAVRATLVETLERTEQEDWPTVIDAFAESLAEADLEPVAEPEPAAAADPAEASMPPAVEQAAAAAGERHTVAKADLDAAIVEAEGDPAGAEAAPEPQAAPEFAEPAEPAAPAAILAAGDAQPEPAPEPAAAAPQPTVAAVAFEAAPPPAEPARPPLAIQNACFASRVQAWGIVDRFAADQFRPGQEVIVYFELDGLSAGESAAGHTTCIDSSLRLVAGGEVVHDWSFEPIAETCRARRHDYFARYVVTIPETAPPGPCRIDLEVTDTLSSQVTTASLPLEIVPVTAAR